MRCVQGVSVTTKTEQGLRRLTQRAHSRVHQVCHVIVGFVCFVLILVFHIVIGVGRPTVQREGFTTSTSFHQEDAIPSVKFFSSGCCTPTSSCHRSLNLYPKFLHIFHLENGSFWSLRARDLLCDFRNSDDLLLLSTEAEESRPV